MSLKGMHPEDIKAAIRKTGRTMSGLSIEWGFDKSACGIALRKPFPSVEPYIANHLGLSLHTIWPDRYYKNNLRIPHSRKRIRKKSSAVTAKN